MANFFNEGLAMIFGVNWNSKRQTEAVLSLHQCQDVQFCEILLDNFLHLDPAFFLKKVGGHRFAFHIMNSAFLERPVEELQEIGSRIKNWIQIVKPLYVSDHVAQFTYRGRLLPFPEEINYGLSLKNAYERVSLWQEILGARIYLENFPSILSRGCEQVSFFNDVLSKTGAGLLFDISNAVVSFQNCGVDPADWLPLAKETRHFHIGGYEEVQTENSRWILDSHDRGLSEASVTFFRRIVSDLPMKPAVTCVIERDFRADYSSWKNDFDTLRSIA